MTPKKKYIKRNLIHCVNLILDSTKCNMDITTYIKIHFSAVLFSKLFHFQAREIFNTLCPGEEFLPKAPNPEDIVWNEDDPNKQTKESGFETEQSDNKETSDKDNETEQSADKETNKTEQSNIKGTNDGNKDNEFDVSSEKVENKNDTESLASNETKVKTESENNENETNVSVEKEVSKVESESLDSSEKEVKTEAKSESEKLNES